MSGLDDRIRDGLERLARPADGSGIIEDVARRKRRLRVVRRVRTATLALAVVAGSAAGVWGLSRAFMGTPDEMIAGSRDVPLIAFHRHEGGAARIYLASETRGVRSLPTVERGAALDPAWSPDGRTIAFTGIGGGTHIWTVRSDGSDPKQITTGDGFSDGQPTWSPDGRRIAFLRNTVSGPLNRPGPTLWVIDLRSGEERMITAELEDMRDPAWSPDGEWIAFVGDEGRGDELSMVDPSGGALIPLTEGQGDARSPTWSPDAARIAYSREGEGLVVRDMLSGHEEVLVRGEVQGPAWSPDGSRIVYAARSSDGWLLHEISVEDRRTGLLWDTAIPGISPSWQPRPSPVAGPTVGPSPTTEKPTCRFEGEPFPGTYGSIDETEGDVSGDGTSVRVSLIADDTRPPECRYFLLVEHPELGYLVAPVPPVEGVPSVPAILMTAEIDGEPGLEIVVDIGGPGPPHRAGFVFSMFRGGLVSMPLGGPIGRGPTLSLPYLWLSGEFAIGIDCAGEPGTIVTTEGSFANGGNDDSRVDITRIFYRAREAVFQRFDSETFTVDVGEERERWPETADDPFRSCPR